MKSPPDFSGYNASINGKKIDGVQYVSLDSLVATFYRFSVEATERKDDVMSEVWKGLGNMFGKGVSSDD